MTQQSADQWRSWQGLLALLSLALCGLLWLNGLLGSLQRPSVSHALEIRQQELAVLAEPAVPALWRRPLLGADPSAALRKQLQQQASGANAEGLNESEQFTLALLDQQRDLPPPPALLTPLQQRLLCQRGSAAAGTCIEMAGAESALQRLLWLTLAPVLLMLLGTVLLLRQLWLWWRRRLPAYPPLLGPPLSLVQVTLVVAGGFVVLGELVIPLLLGPLLAWLLRPLAFDPLLQQAASVLVLYGALMLSPLLLLTLALRSQPNPPSGGWLQWRWRPWSQGLQRAIAQLLMVLPLVALAGWLLQHLWADPSGSNPLLEMVLTSSSPLPLLLLASTALVLAPLFEETLFRGVLMPVLAQHWGAAWGVVLSAACFALAHLSLGELVPLFVLGLGLGWLRLQSGRLASCALMHSLWNGLTFANLLLLAG
ncbi:MAG: CPBP family intramembrane glutamic endopeptidase [Cyanobacteriota bacterium]|nr:CPBP family intramembrane glutamic endopeptidase [Cyanobacteriota bacterium]